MGNLNDKHSDVKKSETRSTTLNPSRKYFSQVRFIYAILEQLFDRFLTTFFLNFCLAQPE